MNKNNLDFTVTKEMLGCPEPRKDRCDDPNQCNTCPNPGGGASAGGGPPGFGGPGGPGTGPNATLRYQGDGAGGPDFPGTPTWNAELGRYWSHDYAQRIFLDPIEQTDGHVWLITESATFREFSGLTGGVYQAVSPSDEFRTLRRTGGGWQLEELDGTVHAFDGGGRWLATTDRNGNAKIGTYVGGSLSSVAFPDGRREDFGYHPSGKLATITEVGVDGTSTAVWTYTWGGDDLARIDRPDGTALEFFYTAKGYLTRADLLPADAGPRRVLQAWSYDGFNNVVQMWRGDPSFAGPDAVETWQLAYDNPSLPTTTTVTDPLGAVSTYSIGRDTNSRKPKLVSLSGDCPTCGTGPNSQLFYTDPAHPLRPTRQLDGAGHETLLAYDGRGQLIAKTEAAMTPLERTTEWDFDSTFPALPVQMRQPSTAGGVAERVTTWVRDPSTGDVTTRRTEGFEAGPPFLFETATTYNTAGQPLSIDPPGFGGADATSFTYDPARGGLVPLSRTDPLIGATLFGVDAFNRRTSVTDPNGVVTETVYDPLDRVRFTIQHGATSAEDLVTEHVYNGYGDLERTILPAGNQIEYGYDLAGRLVSVERKPDAATPGERTLYTLDGASNRIREDLQRWTGTAWTTAAQTEYLYTTRCRLDRMTAAPGTAEEATTEYAYDCDGRLAELWDANHPRFASPPPPPPPPPDGDPLTAPPPAAGAARTGAMTETPSTQRYAYDALERMVSVTQPWSGAGGGDAVTTYGYDVQDHLAAVTDAEGNVTTYAYSDRDLLTQEVSPVSGTTLHAYNEHGELFQTLDARGVVVARELDVLDRVTLIDYADPALDTTYTYDVAGACPASFPIGRLSTIARGATSVDHCYDRFGRLTQDGALTYAYDGNGNRTTIGYPDGVSATYGYDFADREATLAIALDGGPPQPLVSGAGYLPGGPLSSLALGNGLAEARSFDGRYQPARIEVPGLLDALYSTDAVGNVTAIDRAAGADRFLATYDYQDIAYFLTAGQGPWGGEGWSYDRIGNRLSELTGIADSDSGLGEALYQYPLNLAGGHTPQLARIDLPDGGALDYGYDAAGEQTSVTPTGPEGDGLPPHALVYDEASRLARLEDGAEATAFTYDGRGFLALAATDDGALQTEAVYSSDGLLHRRRHQDQTSPAGEPGDDGEPPPPPTISTATSWVLYFAGRPLALLERVDADPDQLLYLTTDHLGSPLLATDAAGAAVWQGGLTPFGRLYTLAGTAPSPGDQDPPGGGGNEDDPNAPPAPPPPPPPGEPPGDGRDGPAPPPPGGGPPNPNPDGREGPPPPPGGGGPPNPNPDGRGNLRASAPAVTQALATAVAGSFLRFPGQWADPTFEATALPGGVYYNVHRWYQPATGRYTRVDPLRREPRNRHGWHAYLYADQQPLSFVDPLGLVITYIEPSLIPFLDCGLQSSPADRYWRHFSGSPEEWEFRSLTVENEPLMGKQARINLEAKGDPGARSVTEPPTYRQPGRFWIETDSPFQCQAIVYNILHEMAHAYSRLVEGKANAIAHSENTNWVQKEADRICKCCDARF